MREYFLQGLPKVKKDDWQLLVKKTYQEIESSIQRLEKEISPVELTSSQLIMLGKVFDSAKNEHSNWIDRISSNMHENRELLNDWEHRYDFAKKYLNRFIDITKNENLCWFLVHGLSDHFDSLSKYRLSYNSSGKGEEEYQRG